MSADRLDVVSLCRRHPEYQTRATWDGISSHPPVWYARPWDSGQDRPWGDRPDVITAATAEDLDELLAKLEAEG
jgi:hypothetical protein